MAKMNFEDFVNSKHDRAWIREPGIEIYVRRSHEVYRDRHGDFMLATLSAKKPGNGALTKFLDKYEKDFKFAFENVQLERFQNYLDRRGYTETSREVYDTTAVVCYIGKEPAVAVPA